MNMLPLLGLDSFIACVALAAYRLSWHERCYLAVMFGLCDGVGTLLSATQGSLLGVSSLTIYFACVLLLACSAPINRPFLIALPAALGIDNLLGYAPASTALAAGFISLAWALLGLQVGAGMRFVFSAGFAHGLCVRTFRRVRAQRHSPAAVTNQ